MGPTYTSSKFHNCNAFPTVWAAIQGCEGKTNRWRYVIGHFGREGAEWVCPTCEVASALSNSLRGKAQQDHFLALEAAAGVENYRTAKCAWVDGRPVLVR